MIRHLFFKKVFFYFNKKINKNETNNNIIYIRYLVIFFFYFLDNLPRHNLDKMSQQKCEIRIYPTFTEVREAVKASNPYNIYLPQDSYNQIMPGLIFFMFKNNF